MSKIKGSLARSPFDLMAGWTNVYRLVSKAMAASGPLAVLIVCALGMFLAAGWVGLGSLIAGETGAWLGSGVGVVTGGLFVGRLLEEL